jgi:serine/threonine protein kinase
VRDAGAELLPRSFGKYTLLRPLATGGMGAVYLATTGAAGMEKFIALKVVLPELAGAEFARRFKDEAKVVVQLSHGNLVQVFEAGDVDGKAYLAMELVEGYDLRSIWNHCVQVRAAFPVEVVVQIVKDALRGLAYAHSFQSLELVHRDISPPNILVAFSGEVKITDFGLAASSLKVEQTRPGIVFGKVAYMSPEQARGEGVDHRADIYPMGVILWELLTGRRLFSSSGDHARDLAARVKNTDVQPPSSICRRVPPQLDEPVLRALAPRPDDRYRSAAEMQRHLASVQAKLWPDLDTDRVAGFMTTLFGDDIQRERDRRHALLEGVRRAPTVIGGRRRADGERAGETDSMPRPHRPPRRVETSLAPSGPMIDNKYRLGRMLGEGGMGQVFEAVHTAIDRRVAVKILHKAYSATPAAVERFRREARAATRIGHPAVVEVLDFGTTEDGRCFYVMELLEGLSLGDAMDLCSPIELERAIDITIQLCDAIQAAHRAGVVHRDLKPENVMLCSEPDGEKVKVLDFGIAHQSGPAQSQERLTRPGATLGTPEYMSPEQAAGEEVDHRADIYSIALLLYEMLTGKTPHQGRTPQEVLLRKLQNPASDITQHRADLSPGLARLIMRGLEEQPERRPASAAELGACLREMRSSLSEPGSSETVESEPVPSPHTSSMSVPGAQMSDAPSGGRTRLTPWGIAGLAVLLIVGAGTVLMTRRMQDTADSSEGSGQPEPAKSETLLLDGGSERDRSGEGSGDRKKPAQKDPLPTNPQPEPSTTESGRAPGSSETPPDARDFGRVAISRTSAKPEESRADPRERTSSAGRKTSATPDRFRPAKPDKPPERPEPTRDLSARELVRKGRRLMGQGKHSQAEDLFRKAKRMPGGSARALTALSELAFQSGRHSKAVRTAVKALEAGGGLRAKIVLANSYYKLGLYKSAMKHFRSVLRIRPGHPVAKRGLAAAQRRLSGRR